MKRLSLLAVAVVVSGSLGGSAHSSVGGVGRARVRLRPSVARLQGWTRITVSGTHVASLQVLPAGATDTSGKPFEWRSLRMVDGSWVATLPSPALRGIYPLRLRVGPGMPSVRSPGWFLRVLAPGTCSRRSFADPVSVVRWWVRAVPGGTVVALRRWPRSAIDHRDTRLHRVFVVAYSRPGHRDPADRLGMFVTAFRDGYGARWQLLDAKVVPYGDG